MAQIRRMVHSMIAEHLQSQPADRAGGKERMIVRFAHDAWKLEEWMSRRRYIFPAARGKVVSDVLGKDACLSLIAQGARLKKDIAVAMVSGMTYHGSEGHDK